MPAERLTDNPVALDKYTVVGTYSTDVDSFVRHVALFQDERREVQRDDRISVFHMGPPLDTAGELSIHVFGHPDLTIDERKQVETWIAQFEDERRPVYIVRPHSDPIRNTHTGTIRRRRFSCTGLVLDCYQEACEITLLETAENTLPRVHLDLLRSAFPDLNTPRYLARREHLGIPGNGPWPVVLSGYVLHALNRTSDEIRAQPYRAKPGDELFRPEDQTGSV